MTALYTGPNEPCPKTVVNFCVAFCISLEKKNQQIGTSTYALQYINYMYCLLGFTIRKLVGCYTPDPKSYLS
jgi:hypothetical protein